MTLTYEYSNAVTVGSLALLCLGSVSSVLKPSRIMLLYVAVLLVFTGSLYGAAQTVSQATSSSSAFTIYTRGMGQLNISLINIYLIVLMFFSLLSLLFHSNSTRLGKEPALHCLFFIAAMYVLYVAGGLLHNVDYENAVSLRGGIGLLNIFMMYVSVRLLLNKPEDIYNLEKVFVVLCLLMAIYGIVRLPLGGDPANYYSQFEHKKARLTFFDFGQAALFCVAFVMVFLRQDGKPLKSLGGGAMILLFLANIVLSYRRNAWLGLVIVFLWFLFTMNVKRKILILALGFMAFTVGAAIFTSRFGVSDGKGTAVQKKLMADVTDKRGQVSFKTGRFSELYAAVSATNSVSPLIGLGPWGVNKAFTVDHGDEPSSFVHSSVVHVYLKMGLLGLVAYLGLLVGFPLWWFRVRRRTWNDQRLRSIGEAFFCGYLFWLPDIFFGTPLINFRHTQLLALFFAVPAAAWAIDSRMQQKIKVVSIISPVLAALAVFIVAQPPGQAIAATDAAGNLGVSTLNETESAHLHSGIIIGLFRQKL